MPVGLNATLALLGTDAVTGRAVLRNHRKVVPQRPEQRMLALRLHHQAAAPRRKARRGKR